MYAKGGKVKKFDGGGVVDTINNFTTGNLRKSLSPESRKKAGEIAKWMGDHQPPSLSELPGKAYSAAKGLNKELFGTKPAYKQGGKLDIAKAIKKPGALRASLGAKKGEPIPAKKLAKAAKAPGKLGQRARFAEMLKGFKKK